MVKIRLARVGKAKRPSYRLVVSDSREARNGMAIDIIGNYDPLVEPEKVVIEEEKALYWLDKGAQPTDTARRLLGKVGIMDKFESTRR